MSTLGFGDIVFESDVGRLFSIIVLTTGVVQVMILLPFVFIRFSPWIERLTRVQVPTHVPDFVKDHIIITYYDPLIVPGLLDRLMNDEVPVYVIQPDKERASELYLDGVPVIVGEADTLETFRAMKVQDARMVLVNDQDTKNTNTILTIRELDQDVHIVAIANQEQSVDILQLSGATHVLPLKRWLGEQLANRVNTFHAQLSDIGVFRELQLSELAVGGSILEGRTVAESKLREQTGVSIVGVWKGSRLKSVTSDLRLDANQVVVLLGTEEQMSTLDRKVINEEIGESPVLVIGGGRVGRAASERLTGKGYTVHIVDKNPSQKVLLSTLCDRVFIGDAAEYSVMLEAGIMHAPAVVITTNDDASNIYLASYCRHLNENVRLVCRITHERNVEACHRAGADLVLRYTSLCIEAVLAVVEQRAMLFLGEHIQFYHIPTPESLYRKTLAESQIGLNTGMIVLAIECNNQLIPNPSKDYVLTKGSTLHVLGSVDQLDQFQHRFKS